MQQPSQSSPEQPRSVPLNSPPRFSATDNTVEWIQRLVRQVRAYVTLHISQRFERIVCSECGSDAPQGGHILHFIGCTVGAYAECVEHIGELPAEVEDLKRPRSFTRAQERDLSALIFEARLLARSRIMTRIRGAELCEECLQAVTEDSLIGHTAECRVGRVFTRLSQLCAEPGPQLRAAALTAGELTTYGEPWRVEGNSDHEWPVRLRNRNGRLVLELRDSEVGDAVEEAFARRIVLAINFLEGMPDRSLLEVLESYGVGNYWIAAVPRSTVGEALLATVKRVVATNLPRPSSELFTEGTYPGAALETGPEGPVDAWARDRHMEPTAQLKGAGTTPAAEAPAPNTSEAPLSPGDAAADRGTEGTALEEVHASAAAEIPPPDAIEEVTADGYANGEPCAICEHAVLDHDDEFGNCTAEPEIDGVDTSCNCPGYRTFEQLAEERLVRMPSPDSHLGASEADGRVVGFHDVGDACLQGEHTRCITPMCQCPCHDSVAECAA